MKRITKILLCVLCAVAAVLCVAAACFMLLKKQGRHHGILCRIRRKRVHLRQGVGFRLFQLRLF